MPADVFEGAAKAGNDEDKISDLLLKSMLYVVEVDVDEEIIALTIGLGEDCY